MPFYNWSSFGSVALADARFRKEMFEDSRILFREYLAVAWLRLPERSRFLFGHGTAGSSQLRDSESAAC